MYMLLRQPLGRNDRSLLSRFRENDHELFTTISGDDIRFPQSRYNIELIHASPEDLCHFAQQLVPYVMAEAIIDEEILHIDYRWVRRFRGQLR